MRKFLNKISLILALILVMCLFTGCSVRMQEDKAFEIVTSFYPIYVFTKTLTEGAENVNVTNMTASDTGCLHDYQLMPRDLKKLEKADLFIINGAGMESFMDKVIEGTDGLEITDTSKDIEIITSDGEANPHIWLYILNARKQVEAITESLVAHNPENTSVYLSNEAEYVSRLNELHYEFNNAVCELTDKKIITTHSAFDYMAHWYGLQIVGTVMSEHNSEPTAAEISQLVDISKNEGVRAIFKEPDYPQTAVNTIAKEAGLPVYTLNPMVSGEEGEYKNVYEKVMRENLAVLKEALE